MPVQSLPKVNKDFEHDNIYGDEDEDSVENRDGTHDEPDDDDNNNTQRNDDDNDQPWDQWRHQSQGNDNAGKCLDELLRLLDIYGF